MPEINPHEPWVAYVVVGLVTLAMLIGKKMIFFTDDKNDKIKEKENKANQKKDKK